MAQFAAESVPESGVSRRDCLIPARDGFLLGSSVFEPVAGGGRKAVIIASATGVKRDRYEKFATFLVEQGWSVVTFDYRGIGDSRRGALTSLTHTMYEWGSEDIAGVIHWIEEHWAPSRLVAVGHSIGGQVIAFAPNRDRLQAMLLVGAQKGYWRMWDGLWCYVCFVFFRCIPLLVRLFGYLPLGFADCEDLPPVAALEWSRWGLNPGYVDRDGAPMKDHHATFAVPIRALSFADDVLAPPRAVDMLLGFYRSARREHRRFHPRQLGAKALGHSGFFTYPLCRPLWEDSSAWLATA